MASQDRTYYAVLGVSRGATAKEIKDAYRRAARSAHPDHGGSSELFHDVAVAYEMLSDPERRRRYDRTLGVEDPLPHARPAPSGRRPRPTPVDTFAQPARYEPSYSTGVEPALPLVIAGIQVHGTARQPGTLARLRRGSGARYDGERATARLLEAQLLPGFPAARLVNGLSFGGGVDVGHAVLAGYRIAVIDSLQAPPGNYSWDGHHLRHRGRPAGDVRIRNSVRRVQDLFPECNVRAWLVLHGRPDNPFEPIIDYPPSLDRSALVSVHVANAGSLLREVRGFLAEGPQPDTVQVPVLARLLRAAAH
ncbi:DnaJ domain-containing protein [Arthrobacter sp. JZ12]|uniref:J domain-containing protein n=1 Tax=Arthrobacter sp. JZ12 TaxID=2654190 RepID=UPI002B45F340|nr:J domain-containing protein [Arthrobacter sp. JZ12]WRH25423.1 DnaJ domain-containing protein [Arthrobacter sp. JZ12]